MKSDQTSDILVTDAHLRTHNTVRNVACTLEVVQVQYVANSTSTCTFHPALPGNAASVIFLSWGKRAIKWMVAKSLSHHLRRPGV